MNSIFLRSSFSRLRIGLLAGLMLGGCATVPRHLVEEPVGTAQLTPVTQSYRDLLHLPAPLGRITVAVYGVRDQTGQFKAAPESSFSTAVTQGASAMLVKILRDSQWFTPVERESLQNLLTERKLIRALEQPPMPMLSGIPRPMPQSVVGSAQKNNGAKTSSASAGQGTVLSSLPPSGSVLQQLTPANLIIEGGIVGYESNVRTGGIGAKYFGMGLSSQYRVDQVTVNLRVVNVRSGEILGSVMTTKTIYSQEIQPSFYRYISFQRLLEAEGGYSNNEPTELCIQDALEAAVIHLILQGVQDKLWSFKDANQMNHPIVRRYLNDRLTQLLPKDPDATVRTQGSFPEFLVSQSN
jgi:curli production assembly/transport component CsgG